MFGPIISPMHGAGISTLGFIALIAAIALAAPAQSPEPPTVEQEVIGNILAQPVGDHRVADYALPEDFVARIADRIICASYQERYRVVVHDPPQGPESPTITTQPAQVPHSDQNPDAPPRAQPGPTSFTPVAFILIALGAILFVGLIWYRKRGHG